MGCTWNPRPDLEQAPGGVLGMLKTGLGLLVAIAIMTVLIIVPAIVQERSLPEQRASYPVAPSLVVSPCDTEDCAFSLHSTESLPRGTHREPATSSMQPMVASDTPIAPTPPSRMNSGGIMREWFEMKAEAKARAGFLQHMSEFARNQGKSSRP